MNETNLLRLALVIKAGNTQTFNSSLVKLVQMVLYESSDYCLNVDNIRKQIAEDYELEFTNDEIFKAIKSKDSGINRIEETRTISFKSNECQEKEILYELNVEIINKFKINETKNSYKSIIRNFIEVHKIMNNTPQEIEEILNKFLYYVFNSNKKTLLLLFNNEKAKILNSSTIIFTEEEKRLINDFLNWEDNSKNSFIYDAISYSVDYCMLTIKKDYSSYRHLFNGKVFYLDANVILRMAGINNDERKSVTNSFIKKCKDNGIKINYTNITYLEIISTIKNQVNSLKSFYNGKRPVATKHFQTFSSPYDNLDFIKLYDKWWKQPGTNYNDYSGFEKYIIKEIDIILQDFKKVDYISYANTDKSTFQGLVESLKEYKSKNRASFSDKSLAIDINNYLYIYKLRESKNGTSFMDISDYFITTDGNLYEWGKEILPSTIPVAVLPSVWHSLLLKFKGRTDNDYKAFTLFLNLRYKINSEGFDERKPAILSIVQNMEEPTDIKNLILNEITDNLLEKYKNIEDPFEIVEEAKNEVIENEIKRIYKEDGIPLINEGKAEGRLKTLYELAEAKAQKRFNCNNGITRFIDCTKIILGILLAVGAIIFIAAWGFDTISSMFKTVIFGYDIFNWVTIIAFAIPGVFFLIIDPIKKQFLSKDFDKLKTEEFYKLTKLCETSAKKAD